MRVGWWEANLTSTGGRWVVSQLTLHPTWQTGDIAVITAANPRHSSRLDTLLAIA